MLQLSATYILADSCSRKLDLSPCSTRLKPSSPSTPSARRRSWSAAFSARWSTARSDEGRPLAGDRGRLRRPGRCRQRLAESLRRARRSSAKNRPTRCALEEGIATLDQMTHFVRSAIPDATPEEVCDLIDRGSGEPRRDILDARPDRRHQGIPAARAVRGRAGARARWPSRSRRPRLPGAYRRQPCRAEWPRFARRRRSRPGHVDAAACRDRRRGGSSTVSTRSSRAEARLAALGRKGAHQHRRDRPARRDARRQRAAGRDGQPGEVRRARRRRRRRPAAAALAIAARLPRKDLGPGGRVDRDRRKPAAASPISTASRSISRTAARSRKTAASWPRTAGCTTPFSPACGKLGPKSRSATRAAAIGRLTVRRCDRICYRATHVSERPGDCGFPTWPIDYLTPDAARSQAFA